MHLLPAVVDALPDAGFTATGRDGFPVVQFLGEPGVAEYNGVITEPAQMGARHGDCDPSGSVVGFFAGQVEVITVKGKSLHQVAHTLSFKTADICTANLAVVLPISRCNAFQHGLIDGEDLLIAFLKNQADFCSFSF